MLNVNENDRANYYRHWFIPAAMTNDSIWWISHSFTGRSVLFVTLWVWARNYHCWFTTNDCLFKNFLIQFFFVCFIFCINSTHLQQQKMFEVNMWWFCIDRLDKFNCNVHTTLYSWADSLPPTSITIPNNILLALQFLILSIKSRWIDCIFNTVVMMFEAINVLLSINHLVEVEEELNMLSGEEIWGYLKMFPPPIKCRISQDF